MTAPYRVRQFFLAAGACLRRREEVEPLVEATLPPAGVRLFQQMPRYDRRHALRVARALQIAGYTGTDLLAAALLHDVGKTADESGRMRLWHRVAVVLLDMWPGLLAKIGTDEPGSWRRPFYVQRQHAALGAEWARRVGCSPVTVRLIRQHEDPPGLADDPLLTALQRADSAN